MDILPAAYDAVHKSVSIHHAVRGFLIGEFAVNRPPGLTVPGVLPAVRLSAAASPAPIKRSSSPHLICSRHQVQQDILPLIGSEFLIPRCQRDGPGNDQLVTDDQTILNNGVAGPM
jgi:hypothetical protein